MFCSSAHTAKIAHVIRLHSLKAERRETLKDILGMHWLNTPPKTYFCSTVLFCLLSVFGNADERMAIRSPPFTCKYQLHGNVQVFTGKWSRDLPNLCFLYWPAPGCGLVAYVKHDVHAWCHTRKGMISIIITNVAHSINSNQNSVTLQENHI